MTKRTSKKAVSSQVVPVIADPKRYLNEYLEWEKSMARRLNQKLDKPIIQMIKKFLEGRTADCRILEVGFCTGRLLKKLRSEFPFAELTGIDINPESTKIEIDDVNLLEGSAFEFPEGVQGEYDIAIFSLSANLMSDEILKHCLALQLPQHLKTHSQVIFVFPDPEREKKEKKIKELPNGSTVIHQDTFGGGETCFIRNKSTLGVLDDLGYQGEWSESELKKGTPGYLFLNSVM